MKKTLCILLCAVLLAGCFTPAFAADAALSAEEPAAAAAAQYPLVIARGMDFDGIYTVNDAGEKVLCFHGITAGGIIKTLGKTVKNAFTMGLRHGFAAAAVDYVWEVMGDMACGTDGRSVKDVRCDRYFGSMARFEDFWSGVHENESKEDALVRTACETVGAENVYYFTYDYRLDPFELADDLRDWIELAKTEHGTDRVTLVNCSMAGVITDCYLYKYGASSLAKVLFLSSTFCGTDMATEILQKQVGTDETLLENYLRTLLGDRAVIRLLRRTGLLKTAANVLNRFVSAEIDYVFDACMRDIFGTMLSYWANVQPGAVDDAVACLFPTQEEKETYAVLIEKIYRLKTVMENRETLLSALPAQGVAVAVVAGYNSSPVPIYPGAGMQSDGILDTRWMLGGAAVTPMGTASSPGNALTSPDGNVDLANVLFPQYTWAIRDCGHVPVQYGSDCSRLIMQILSYDGQPTVESFAEFPQFFTVDAKTKNLLS